MRITLPVMRWGSGERRALLVHGLTSSARVWWRVASELADRGWDVTAVDLRGHGLAPPSVRYPIAELADDLTATGREWDVAVGHSLGGAAVVVAAHHAGWAERLVLVEPVISVSDVDRDEVERGLLVELEMGREAVAAANPAWHADDVFWKVWSARQCSPSVVRGVMADNDPWDVTNELREVPVPCTVLAGEPVLGSMTDAAAARAFGFENPRIHLIEVEGVGHSVFREHPDVVVQAVER